ncbi:hypothetical protein THIOM_002483 [Candidatus Thiomargarita nelsonii]|uniref:Uncharacterized protein n=1 Tax=Candidatus Thiomargarita nelsonii TaxID=1003181 RepID=A0A176S181_9GAMM|nr:hypothetical protein THIOM_002483 [Candidatus Thiomargarita nelsonii]
MTEVFTDTGPVLHLNEINKLLVLELFEQIKLPDFFIRCPSFAVLFLLLRRSQHKEKLMFTNNHSRFILIQSKSLHKFSLQFMLL